MLLYTALEILMITRLGRTPGKLLCGIHIKDANTLENVELIQAVIRSAIKSLFVYIISESRSNPLLNLILETIIVIIFVSAIYSQHKQFFHDKIARTVVIDPLRKGGK